MEKQYILIISLYSILTFLGTFYSILMGYDFGKTSSAINMIKRVMFNLLNQNVCLYRILLALCGVIYVVFFSALVLVLLMVTMLIYMLYQLNLLLVNIIIDMFQPPEPESIPEPESVPESYSTDTQNYSPV